MNKFIEYCNSMMIAEEGLFKKFKEKRERKKQMKRENFKARMGEANPGYPLATQIANEFMELLTKHNISGVEVLGLSEQNDLNSVGKWYRYQYPVHYVIPIIIYNTQISNSVINKLEIIRGQLENKYEDEMKTYGIWIHFDEDIDENTNTDYVNNFTGSRPSFASIKTTSYTTTGITVRIVVE